MTFDFIDINLKINKVIKKTTGEFFKDLKENDEIILEGSLYVDNGNIQISVNKKIENNRTDEYNYVTVSLLKLYKFLQCYELLDKNNKPIDINDIIFESEVEKIFSYNPYYKNKPRNKFFKSLSFNDELKVVVKLSDYQNGIMCNLTTGIDYNDSVSLLYRNIFYFDYYSEKD